MRRVQTAWHWPWRMYWKKTGWVCRSPWPTLNSYPPHKQRDSTELLNKQLFCQCFETPWCSCHCNEYAYTLGTMMTSSNGNIFRVTDHLWGEFTGYRWTPRSKASDTELWCFFLCAWINGWVNNREAADLRHHGTHYDATVMTLKCNLLSVGHKNQVRKCSAIRIPHPKLFMCDSSHSLSK